MHLKFIDRGEGSTKSAVKYLLQEKDHKGKERPIVKVMHGDPDFIADLGDSLKFKHRYSSAVISWAPEDMENLTDEKKREVLESFERYTFAGLDPDQYAYLAVDHGDHIHVIIPRVELTTGKSMNIAPPGWQKYFDVWRDFWNEKEGWKSPDIEAHPENKRTISIDPYKLPKKAKEAKEILHEAILGEIEAGNIQSREDIEEFFKGIGGEITRSGENYISVKLPGFKRAIRLKGGIYERGQQLGSVEREDTQSERRGAQRDKEDNGRKLEELLTRLEKNAKRRAQFNTKRYRGGEEDEERGKLWKQWLECERSDIGGDSGGDSIDNRNENIRERDKNNTAGHDTGGENRERDTDKMEWENVVRRQNELAAYRASKSLANRKREYEMKRIANDPNEIERWKKGVDLIQLAMEHGYEIVKKKSTERSVQMSNGGDKIVISKNDKTGHWQYYKMHSGEGGSVIDFLQNENPGMSLGEVRKYLREWNGEPVEIWEYLDRDRGDVERKGADERERIKYIWSEVLGGGFAGTIIKDDDDHYRGISTEVLQEIAHNDRLIYKGGDEQALYFKLLDETGQVCGIAKHTLSGEKRLIKGSKKGIWTDRKGISEAERVVISESPIDTISYRILDGNSDDYLIATMGEVSGKTKEIIESIGKKGGFRDKEVVLAFDNDPAGERFSEEVGKIVEKYGGKIVREKSANKDWNDDLQALAKKVSNAIGTDGEYKFNPPFSVHARLITSGYFVKTYKNTGYTLVANKEKGVKVVDKHDKIEAQGENLEEQARIMIDMAVEKGWDLRKVKVTGSDEFKRIAHKLIDNKIGIGDVRKRERKTSMNRMR